ncbi:hypothetical protein ACA910_000546 [Epithemia clementina (nom. ined.)]
MTSRRKQCSQPMPIMHRRRKRPLSSAVAWTVVAVAFSSTRTTATAEGVERNDEQDTRCGPSLACQNGGLCRQGDASWPGGDDSTSTNGNRLPFTLQQGTNVGGSYCDCVNTTNNTNHEGGISYTGLSCEIPYQECNYSTGYAICYHGGSCLDQPPPASAWGDDTNMAVCNCETAIHKGSVYGGRNCELMIGDNPCQSSQDEPYCLHGGVCNSEPDPTGSHCACTNGFTGQRCETAISATEEDCNLKCHHDGTCQFLSIHNDDGDENDGVAPWGSWNGMYCQCLMGYSGVQCEHIAQQCGNELVCLHGSTCVVNQELSAYECQCAPTEYYIGGTCVNPHPTKNNENNDTPATTTTTTTTTTEHLRITHCNPTSASEFAYGMAVASFCANGGTCQEEVVDGLLFSTCDCPVAFSGPHCEHVRSASDGQGSIVAPPIATASSKQSNDSYMKDRMAGNIVLLTLCSFGCVWLVREGFRKYMARKRRKDEVVLNLQSFREENHGAVSANGSMLFPSAMSHNRSFGSGNQFSLEELMHDVEIT